MSQVRKKRGIKTDAIVKTINQIDNWAKNWLDNKLKNYGVRDFDKAIKDLTQDWLSL